jgi:hypothetical protein
MVSTQSLLDAMGLFSSKSRRTKHAEHGKKNTVEPFAHMFCEDQVVKVRDRHLGREAAGGANLEPD